jgi:hypothetical protein
MSPAELQRINASQGWRQRRIEVSHDTSEGTVLARGQCTPRPRRCYRLPNGVAHAVGLTLLRVAPTPGVAQAPQIELSWVHRLRQLRCMRCLRRRAAAGVQPPKVLPQATGSAAARWLGARRLEERLQRDAETALPWRQRGLRTRVVQSVSRPVLSAAATSDLPPDTAKARHARHH